MSQGFRRRAATRVAPVFFPSLARGRRTRPRIPGGHRRMFRATSIEPMLHSIVPEHSRSLTHRGSSRSREKRRRAATLLAITIERRRRADDDLVTHRGSSLSSRDVGADNRDPTAAPAPLDDHVIVVFHDQLVAASREADARRRTPLPQGPDARPGQRSPGRLTNVLGSNG
jgi:hypothetical protein